MWREELKRKLEGLNLHRILAELKKRGLDVYKTHSAVYHILAGSVPNLDNLRFLNFLKGIDYSDLEIGKIINEILKEDMGISVSIEDLELAESLPKGTATSVFVAKKLREFRHSELPAYRLFYQVGINDPWRVAKGEKKIRKSTAKKLLGWFGREYIPYFLADFLSQEYLSCLKKYLSSV